jgi:hypothetical protein
MTAGEIMKLIACRKKRDAFVQACRKTGLPRIKINKRVFRYRRDDVMLWLKELKPTGL